MPVTSHPRQKNFNFFLISLNKYKQHVFKCIRVYETVSMNPVDDTSGGQLNHRGRMRENVDEMKGGENVHKINQRKNGR